MPIVALLTLGLGVLFLCGSRWSWFIKLQILLRSLEDAERYRNTAHRERVYRQGAMYAGWFLIALGAVLFFYQP